MRAVFAHDHRFISTPDGIHDKGGLPEEVLQRYVRSFGALTVIGREQREGRTSLPAIVDENIDFVLLPNIRSIHGVRHLLVAQRAIERTIRAADVVIARLPSMIGLMAVRAARRHSTPCMVEVVGNALEANMLHGSLLGTVIAPVEHGLMRIAVRRADTVVYITENYLQKIYRTSGAAYVCPNVEVNVVDAEYVRLRPNGKRRVIGLVGSLDVDYKGHETALRVLASLRRDFGVLNVHLEFLGRGSSARWQKIARELGVVEYVHFAGGLPPGQPVLEWMDRIDVLLQPSQTEGQGRSIVEAMSRGRPIFATRVGGIPELLGDDDLFAPDDVKGMASACHELFRSDLAAISRSERNLLAARSFDASTINARRASIYERFRSSAVTR